MPATIDGRRAAVRGVAFAASTHPGLWLDRYLAHQRLPDVERGEKHDDAGNALRDLLRQAAGAPVPEGYVAACRRRSALLETIDGGIEGGLTAVFTAEARGRIVVGLGAHSVRETNLALLHTWGVPYLPGSALKGLASAAAHQLGADPAWKKAGKQTPHGDEHARMFGDPKTAGYVVFHDAWWIPENAVTLPLDLDVMTVHHPDYYRDGRSAPADWDEPNPVGFLTAQGKYLVALSGPDAWVERAGAWLSAGLRELGLGAKTQAGYGRMTLTAVPTQRDIEATAQRAKHRATLDALANLPAQHKGAATARQHVEKLREAIRAGAPAAAVHEIARALGERDRKFWKKWAADERRTPEEQAFVSESGMIGPEPGGQTR